MDALFTWSDDLSVGIQEIDEQHKELVLLLNRLHDAVVARHGSAACVEILNQLAEYTRVHFIVEESLMRILHYPDFEQHKGEHEALVEQVVALQQKLGSGQAAITFELLHFLKLWLTKHIAGSDRRYASFFIGKGMAPEWAHHVEQSMRKKWSWKFW
jgi:hemerythrin